MPRPVPPEWAGCGAWLPLFYLAQSHMNLDKQEHLASKLHQTIRELDFWKQKAEILQEDCAEWLKESDNSFSIKEIADYLAGWQAADDKFAHHNALSQLQDDQDGINAVRERNNARQVITKF